MALRNPILASLDREQDPERAYLQSNIQNAVQSAMGAGPETAGTPARRGIPPINAGPVVPAIRASAPPPLSMAGVNGQPNSGTAPAITPSPRSTSVFTEVQKPQLPGLQPLPGLRPLVKLSPNPLDQIEGNMQNRLNRLQWQDANPYGSANNHPGFWGKLGHIASVAGQIAGTAVAPGVVASIPGTQLNRHLQERSLTDNIRGIEQERGLNAEREANMQDAQARRPLIDAQTREANARADQLENPQPAPKEERWTVSPEFIGPNGEPVEVEQNSGQMRLAQNLPAGIKRVPKSGEDKEESPEQQAFHGYIAQGMSPMEAWNKVREREHTSSDAGTWQLAEDKDGNPVLYNSKTAQQKPAGGLQKPGTHAKQQQGAEGEDMAINYAEDYLRNGVFTGSGDEALQEKFFELAKPKTGFRMTQPQMDMLRQSRGWMSGMAAHIRHATTGTWFTPQQRQQIVDTMRQLSAARRETGTQGGDGGGQGLQIIRDDQGRIVGVK